MQILITDDDHDPDDDAATPGLNQFTHVVLWDHGVIRAMLTVELPCDEFSDLVLRAPTSPPTDRALLALATTEGDAANIAAAARDAAGSVAGNACTALEWIQMGFAVASAARAAVAPAVELLGPRTMATRFADARAKRRKMEEGH